MNLLATNSIQKKRICKKLYIIILILISESDLIIIWLCENKKKNPGSKLTVKSWAIKNN